MVGFIIAYKAINKKNGANSDLLDPYELEIDSSSFEEVIQSVISRENIQVSCLDQDCVYRGVKKGKYNVFYCFICLSEFEIQHRDELNRAEAIIERAMPSKITRQEYLKHIEFDILVAQHITASLKALVNQNLAVSPKNKEYILAHNYYAVVDISQRKLLIPAFWGDDFASERKYEYCVKRIIFALNAKAETQG